MRAMKLQPVLEQLGRNPLVRLAMFALGCVFIIAAPLVSPLPGPGGLICVAIGLTLILRTSIWARRRYVHFKRKRPKMGSWTDWSLRRKSARRRLERDRQAGQTAD